MANLVQSFSCNRLRCSDLKRLACAMTFGSVEFFDERQSVGVSSFLFPVSIFVSQAARNVFFSARCTDYYQFCSTVGGQGFKKKHRSLKVSIENAALRVAALISRQWGYDVGIFRYRGSDANYFDILQGFQRAALRFSICAFTSPVVYGGTRRYHRKRK